ncbi:unnamed protein product [Dicrocoelium dendriticum]|nr:unnamed protein product [Dicrocoelium dendriticum]
MDIKVTPRESTGEVNGVSENSSVSRSLAHSSTFRRELACALHDIGVIKFGEFRLKYGILSPVYVDLRLVVSVPPLLMQLAKAVSSMLSCDSKFTDDLICGVPYSALPIATCVSTLTSIPLIICRKETKSYGTRQVIEGIWEMGQKCVIIEDVVTSGCSVASVAKILRSEGVSISRAIVLVDREQGGVHNLSVNDKISVHSLFTLTELSEILLQEGRISADEHHRVVNFILSTPITEPLRTPPVEFSIPLGRLSLEQVSENKRSRVCVAIDTTDANQLLRLADTVGPSVCAIKMHLDLLDSRTNADQLIYGLRELANQHGFVLLEDRKLADIGQTALQQLSKGIYRVAEWCHLVTVHCIAGSGVLQAFRTANEELSIKGKSHCIKALPVLQMSSRDNLLDDSYSSKCLRLCEAYTDVIAGFVCQNPIAEADRMLEANPCASYWIPGVHMHASGDQLGQTYCTVDSAVERFRTVQSARSNLILIVGRGITDADDPSATAELYRAAVEDAIKTSSY